MFYTVYKTTNLITGKIYIGVHRTKNLEDNYFGSNKELKIDIKKLGKNNFKKEILFFCSSVEEMYFKEEELVDFNFVNRKDTYNIMVGGYGCKEMAQSTKILLSEINKGIKRPHISESNKKRPGEDHPLYNTKRPPETLKKMSDSHKGQIPWCKGKQQTEEHRKNNILGQKNRKKYLCSCGRMISGLGNLKQHKRKCEFSIENNEIF